MADVDEYDLLDAQLDAGKSNGAAEKADGDRSDRKHRSSHKSSRHRDNEKDRERKSSHRSSHKSSRHRDDDDDERSERKRRHRSRSRDKGSHRSSRPREEEGRERHRSSSRHRSSRPAPPMPVALPSPPRRRAPTPPEVLEQRERERELKELDRDTRTVFAYNLNLKADEKDLFDFFSRAGTVEDVRIIMDRNTRRSKGFAYIEMGSREAVVQAVALGGQTLMGQTVMVKPSEAEKNLAWEAAQVQNQQMQAVRQLEGATGSGPCKLHIRNLHVAMSEDDVRDIFAPYGPLDLVQIQRDGAGKSQGHGYVTFSNMADATRAIPQLNGLEIAGAAIKVEIAADPAAAAAAFAAGAAQDGLADNEADDGGGMRLTASSRAQLMSRLAGGATAAPAAGGAPGPALPGPPPGFVLPGAGAAPVATAPSAPPLNPLSYVQGILGPSSPVPTQCLLLKNMFDPAEETEPNWPEEIAGDVKEECGKYGMVSHLHVDKDSKGFVYVKFATITAAEAAQKALHGRWFAGKQICAEFQLQAMYRQHFGE